MDIGALTSGLIEAWLVTPEIVPAGGPWEKSLESMPGDFENSKEFFVTDSLLCVPNVFLLTWFEYLFVSCSLNGF